MRRVTTLAAFVAALALSLGAAILPAGAACAGEDAAAGVTNKFCPIMGADSPVDPKVRVEHDGQFVYFCCAGCKKKFEANPAAAIAKMSAEEQAAIKVNDVCPTTGEKVENRDVKVEHNGRNVYFCCAGCKTPYVKKHAIAAN
jgi:YHS domain-containing protein